MYKLKINNKIQEIIQIILIIKEVNKMIIIINKERENKEKKRNFKKLLFLINYLGF